MLSVNNKFNIGDKLFTYYRKNYEAECPFCHGSGSLNIHDHDVDTPITIKCKNCYGQGVIKTNITYVSPIQVKVDKIKATISKDCTSVKYKVHSLDPLVNVTNRSETTLFSTLEEVQEVCNQINLQSTKGEL